MTTNETETSPDRPSISTVKRHGKICPKHPDLEGGRNYRHQCVGCYREDRRNRNATARTRVEFFQFAMTLLGEHYPSFDPLMVEIVVHARAACRADGMPSSKFFAFLPGAEREVRGERQHPADRTNHDLQTARTLEHAKLLCRTLGFDERQVWLVWDDAVEQTRDED